jgi:hypothetical protein
MNIALRRLGMGVLGCVMLATLAGCVASVGVADDYDGPGYVESGYVGTGVVYGGWDRYHVGPPRGGERRPEARAHAYRSPDRSRPTPSIPNRAHHH